MPSELIPALAAVGTGVNPDLGVVGKRVDDCEMGVDTLFSYQNGVLVRLPDAFECDAYRGI